MSEATPLTPDELPPRVAAVLLDLCLRNDFAAFVEQVVHTVLPEIRYEPNWHVEAIAFAIDEVRTGIQHRLIVNCPPRSLKSLIVSVALPAFILGHDPSQKIIVASYGADLSLKLARDFRLVVRSAWFQRLFPRFQIARDAEAELTTTMRGFRLATSVGGVLTGRGGDWIIIDDPIKADDAMSASHRRAVIEWFTQSLISRLDDKRDGKIIVAMQRVHVDDLSGHLLKAGTFNHLTLPAIAAQMRVIPLAGGAVKIWREGEPLDVNRLPPVVLEQLRSEMGGFAFSAQYLQQPIPEDGQIVKWEWFRRYAAPPPPEIGDIILQSWDTAAKAGGNNDYSVCTTWRIRKNDDAYLLDVYRAKLVFPDLVRAVESQALRYQAATILIEDVGSGTGLIQQLRGKRLRTIPIKPDGDKVTRMSTQSPAIEAGKVFIPENAPWLDALHTEVASFPNGSHDDQIDSISQALSWSARRNYGFPQCFSGVTGRRLW